MKKNESLSFVIVGQPNKGKSSIVATLAYNDQIKISHIAGETKKTEEHALSIDGEVLYKIYDTPGFQNSREVLKYFKEHHKDDEDKTIVLKKFIHAYKGSGKYEDEIELLTPIMQGGAIIYIVDGSHPVTKRYAPEMELLSWLDNPSMAFINKIKTDEYYLEEWRRELKKYFPVIREYNPIHATLKDKVNFLKSFALLNQEWEPMIEKAVKAIENNFKTRVNDTIKAITENTYKSITYKNSFKPLIKNDISQDDEKRLEKQYQEHIKKLEINTHEKIKYLWGHYSLKSDINDIHLTQTDLFSKESSNDGLLKKSLMIASTITGGTIAGTTTAAVTAHTSLVDFGVTTLVSTSLATLGGGLTGLASAIYGYDNLMNKTIFGNFISGKTLEIGPVKNENFIFIISARAIKYALAIIQKSHADRENLFINYEQITAETIFEAEDRKVLIKIHHSFIKNKEIEKNQRKYEEIIKKVINKKLHL